MLYVKQPQGTWADKRDLSYWSAAFTQTSSAERSTLRPTTGTLRGGLPASARPHEEKGMGETTDHPRASSAGPVLHHLQQGNQWQQPPAPQQQSQEHQPYQGYQSYQGHQWPAFTTSQLTSPPPPPQQQQQQEGQSQASSPAPAPAQASSPVLVPVPAPAPATSEPDTYEGTDPETVAAALEAARDSPEGALDPEVSDTLQDALSQIWARVLARPGTYVMTRGEFAVFNLYQHLFRGSGMAMEARRRFWNNTHG